MGIIIGMIIICIIISIFFGYIDNSFDNKLKTTLVMSGVYSFLACIIFLVITLQSYFNYLEMRAFYDATVEQYATAIEMYEDKAVIDIGRAAWTDFKYHGYQDNVAGFIKSLRNGVISYNRKFIEKREMDSNLVFNWLIIAPGDDMKIIKMKTAKNHIE